MEEQRTETSRPAAAALDAGVLSRARGCLLGQLAGDSLGSLVEFQGPDTIRRAYPNGVRRLADGGVWGTLAGQPTDDSEMALALARVLDGASAYDADRAREAYVAWLDSGPFDCGMTVSRGLRGRPDPDSQANGALMRIAPLGIFAAGRNDPAQAAGWARRDAAITHPHRVCGEANALFVMAIAKAIRDETAPGDLYEWIVARAAEMAVEDSLMTATTEAARAPPDDTMRRQGWVLIAWRNALWRLLHAPDPEEAVVGTVMSGGDTDTNAAICGALLGAVHGEAAIPAQWTECVLNCRPAVGAPGVRHPRPERYWPVDAPELAERLVRVP